MGILGATHSQSQICRDLNVTQRHFQLMEIVSEYRINLEKSWTKSSKNHKGQDDCYFSNTATFNRNATATPHSLHFCADTRRRVSKVTISKRFYRRGLFPRRPFFASRSFLRRGNNLGMMWRSLRLEHRLVGNRSFHKLI